MTKLHVTSLLQDVTSMASLISQADNPESPENRGADPKRQQPSQRTPKQREPCDVRGVGAVVCVDLGRSHSLSPG
ncbi:hypothetical protein BaRGS_00020436 [Batillaria attramentaria]|uniref:Uncharacterized protein n=1 Tax=Batillaria attramentaria TaxID=370345 RepID=A0ABD0KMX7_9CAEN